MQDQEQELRTEDVVFSDSYETTLHYLEQRQKTNEQSVMALEGELHHLTVYEGQDWGGRGELKNSEIQGQIYAYIAFINSVKKQNEESNP